jgi:transcription termination factor NusB
MMQQLQKQAQELQKTQEAGGAQFAQVQKTNQVTDVNKVQEVGKANEATKATDVLKTAQTNALQKGDNARLGVKTVDGAKETQKGGFKRLLDQIVEGQNKLDDIIKMSLSGKKFDYQELLAIQASVHKFSQELELTSKVVEKATSGVKQTMQTQV